MPLGKLVCINERGNADIWSPLETLSCVSTKVLAANSSARTDIIQISRNVFECTAAAAAAAAVLRCPSV